MTKVSIYLFLGLLTLSLLGFFIFGASRAIAASAGASDDVDLHIKVEVSADQGATWSNFSGTEDAGGDVVAVSPGDELQYRVKVWNTGTINANNVDILGTVSNASYVASTAVTASDFLGFAFAEGRDGTAGIVEDGSTEEAGFYSVTGTLTLADSFPVGQTLISGSVNITDYLAGEFALNPIQRIAKTLGISKAKALGVDRVSGMRIAVTVAAPVTETATAATPAATATTLPDSGGSIMDAVNKYFRF